MIQYVDGYGSVYDFKLNDDIDIETILSHLCKAPFDITCRSRSGKTTFGKELRLVYKSPYKGTFKRFENVPSVSHPDAPTSR
jgi:hypothetical protein